LVDLLEPSPEHLETRRIQLGQSQGGVSQGDAHRLGFSAGTDTLASRQDMRARLLTERRDQSAKVRFRAAS
jgi:hypothetical protein